MSAENRHVIGIREDATVMWIETGGGAKAFARQLIRDGKAFHCEPSDEGWEFVVYETNERGGLAGIWADH